jgi:hypothetical protein
MTTKVYLLIFIGTIAISVAFYCLLAVDPKNEIWTSVAIGAVSGFLSVLATGYFKNKQANKA